MSNPNPILQRLTERKLKLKSLREKAADLLINTGARGSQVSTWISERVDAFLIEVFEETLEGLDASSRARILAGSCVVGVGGTGRKEPALYSDVDLMFLHLPTAQSQFTKFTSAAVRDLWDVGLKLGHSLHTPATALQTARQEIQFSTSLCESRLLWGSQDVFDNFKSTMRRKFFLPHMKRFVLDCIAGRAEESDEHGSTIKELEPDIKKSLGGLRDVHLIRWVGFAVHGTTDIDSLRMAGALRPHDARRLQAAWEFLMQIRMELHVKSGRPMDVLTRDDQLWLTNNRRIEGTDGQRDVEVFMQTFFQHSANIAEIAEHFVKRNIPGSWLQNFWSRLTARRLDDVFIVSRRGVDIVPQHHDEILASLEKILRLYRTAHLCDAPLVPEVADALREREIDAEMTTEVGRVFRQILRGGGRLGQTLRGMYHTRVLDALIPDVAHLRGLLQFNQYHHYTVDEHTFRAIEAVRQFEFSKDQFGSAYRHVRHKATLHLAVLLHDIGKGFDEDHSEVGARISLRIAQRLNMTEHKTDMLHFLVLKHLRMAHIAFRRDISDENLLIEFAHEVGSAERLRMLYVLTAADIQAVGPGAWTEWKAELLTELYNRSMLILSGQPVRFFEVEMMNRVTNRVRNLASDAENADAMLGLLPRFPAHYFVDSDEEEIVRDLQTVLQMDKDEVRVVGRYNADLEIVDYVIFASGKPSVGCFHKIAGVLTALRMEILVARIATTKDGIVVDRFRVRDRDFIGAVPDERMDNVATLVKSALSTDGDVQKLIHSSRTFGPAEPKAALFSNLETRVVVDNDSSLTHTVIDVFAHDRPGLLFVITRTIYRMGLSVGMAKISTHLDQVVDVFYVTDENGRKLPDSDRLNEIRNTLLDELAALDCEDDLASAVQ